MALDEISGPSKPKLFCDAMFRVLWIWAGKQSRLYMHVSHPSIWKKNNKLKPCMRSCRLELDICQKHRSEEWNYIYLHQLCMKWHINWAKSWIPRKLKCDSAKSWWSWILPHSFPNFRDQKIKIMSKSTFWIFQIHNSLI